MNSSEEINTSKFVWKATKGARMSLMLYTLIEIVNDVLGIFVAQHLNRKMINYLSIENPVLETGIFLVLLYVWLNNITYITKSLALRPRFRALNRVKENVRVALFNRTMQHSMNYFNSSFSGALNTKINNAVGGVETILDCFRDLFCYIVIFSIIPLVYSEISLYIGVAFFIISTLYIIALVVFRKKIKNAVGERAENVSKYFGIINDNFTNIINVKMFSRERDETRKSKRQSLEILRSNAKIVEYEIYYKIVNLIFCFSLFFSVLGTSAYMLAENKITIADFTYVVIIVSIARFVINQAALKIIVFTVAKSELINSLQTLMRPVEIQNKSSAKILKVSGGKIVFRNLFFGYRKGAK